MKGAVRKKNNDVNANNRVPSATDGGSATSPDTLSGGREGSLNITDEQTRGNYKASKKQPAIYK